MGYLASDVCDGSLGWVTDADIAGKRLHQTHTHELVNSLRMLGPVHMLGTTQPELPLCVARRLLQTQPKVVHVLLLSIVPLSGILRGSGGMEFTSPRYNEPKDCGSSIKPSKPQTSVGEPSCTRRAVNRSSGSCCTSAGATEGPALKSCCKSSRRRLEGLIDGLDSRITLKLRACILPTPTAWR